MNVQTLILKGGLELISEVEKRGDRLILRRPYRIVYGMMPMPTPQGITMQTVIQPMPFLASTENEITIHMSDLLDAPKEPFREAKDNYIQQVTGIQLAH